MRRPLGDIPAPEIYTLKEACTILRISKSTAHRMIKKGELRTLRFIADHRVTSLELERLMAEHGIYVGPKR